MFWKHVDVVNVYSIFILREQTQVCTHTRYRSEKRTEAYDFQNVNLFSPTKTGFVANKNDLKINKYKIRAKGSRAFNVFHGAAPPTSYGVILSLPLFIFPSPHILFIYGKRRITQQNLYMNSKWRGLTRFRIHIHTYIYNDQNKYPLHNT